MRVFDLIHYKEIIRAKTKELSKQRLSLTLKSIAAKVPMQYTYLSRALNREDTHLTEDQLYSICQQLEFFSEEIEYIFLLRSLEVTSHPGRHKFIRKKIEHLKCSKSLMANVEKTTLDHVETKFLLSPLAWVTYFCLTIPEYQTNPKKIAKNFGISEKKLLKILQDLSEQSLIEIENSPWNVKRTLKNHFHYSPSHPLTRLHQQLLKEFSNQHLQKVSEDERVSFMATFNGDMATFELIKEKFQLFIRETEKIAIKSPSKKSYQLIFDLFSWN